MRTHRDLASGWLRRLLRGWRLDRNPLRRTSDRAQTLILAGLVAAFLASFPFVATAGGSLAHDLARNAQQAQQAAERQVTAVTLEAAPPPGHSSGMGDPSVTARWTAPDGQSVTGVIPVSWWTPAGASEPVWVTRSGELAIQPLLGSQIDDLTMLGRVASVVAVAVALALAWALARRRLDKQRYAAWDADWEATDPRGTQRT